MGIDETFILAPGGAILALCLDNSTREYLQRTLYYYSVPRLGPRGAFKLKTHSSFDKWIQFHAQLQSLFQDHNMLGPYDSLSKYAKFKIDVIQMCCLQRVLRTYTSFEIIFINNPS